MKRSLLKQLEADFSTIQFVESDKSKWAPEKSIIYFKADSRPDDWSLLHEVGHMLAGHTRYSSDIELLQMESEAWAKARSVGKKYGITLDPEHIEQCLDSYRDWLYRRSKCPNCSQTGLEQTTGHYKCINCEASWTVSRERFCRVYRRRDSKKAT